jgi:hypothetical protein
MIKSKITAEVIVDSKSTDAFTDGGACAFFVL